VESKHPYSNNLDQWMEVEVPNAAAVKVVFSDKTKTMTK